MMSRVIGYARDAYIALAYGAGGFSTDAYVAAFTLPDFLNYIVAGGAASITFISIYTRFLAEKREGDAEDIFHNHYCHDCGDAGGHNLHRDFHDPVCALDVWGDVRACGISGGHNSRCAFT